MIPHRRRPRAALLLTFAALPLTACAPHPTPDALVTRRVDLVDDAGIVRARLGIDADGSAGLFLIGPDGLNRAALITDDAQTALYLFDPDGAIRVGVAQFAHGGGGVALHGAAGRGATVLYMKDGAGSLTLFDPDGATRARWPDSPAPTATGDDR
ncbi:MAG: hypothetical protein KDA25_06865 [Phycisphaerales bacterium]|nr:hypothetical protein [Phycisphaerales bacterium]